MTAVPTAFFRPDPRKKLYRGVGPGAGLDAGGGAPEGGRFPERDRVAHDAGQRDAAGRVRLHPGASIAALDSARQRVVRSGRARFTLPRSAHLATDEPAARQEHDGVPAPPARRREGGEGAPQGSPHHRNILARARPSEPPPLVLGAGAGAGIAAAGDADPPWIVPTGHDTAEIACRVPLIRRKGKRSTVLD